MGCICWSSVGLGCQSPRPNLQMPEALHRQVVPGRWSPHANRCGRLRGLGCKLGPPYLKAPCRRIWQMDANSRVVEACICWSSVGLGCQSLRTHLQIPKALGWYLVWYADATRCRQHRCRGRKLYAHDPSVRFAELVGLAT